MNIVLLEHTELEGGFFTLARTDERYKHITKILKLSAGAVFKTGIINGKKGIAEIITHTAEALTARFTVTGSSIPLYPIRLLLGFPRPIQLRRILRDAAGLGIEALYLTGTELGEKSYMDSGIADTTHIERLLRDGCSQAGQTDIPAVFFASSVQEFFNRFAAELAEPALKAVLDVPPAVADAEQLPRAPAAAPSVPLPAGGASRPVFPLPELRPPRGSRVWLAVGSERGWSNRERHCFYTRGFTAYTMGSRILRTETAVNAAVSVCIANAGYWD